MLDVTRLDVFHGDLQVLWGVSLTVDEGEIAVLIGPNGAGKSTLMRTIAGLQRPAAGRITLEGTAIHRLPPHEIVERGVLLVPEGRRLFGSMSVEENLELGAFSPRARRERAAGMRRVYDLFPVLAERRTQPAATLSGGQQQMLALGRALMGLPRLLLLDEPSLGLAPLVVQSIFEVVREINRGGVTVLLVEQNARMALELAQRAYIIEQGRVKGAGSGHALLAEEHVRRAYLGEALTVDGAEDG